MTDTELLREGLKLMCLGIGFVMAFLLILIYAIGAMSKIINRFFPETDPAAVHAIQVASPSISELDQLRPVIIAAIVHHRHKQGQH